MSWYLYKHPNGAAELVEGMPVSPSMRPDLLFMGQYEIPPNIHGMEFGPDNQLRRIVPEWISNRRASYPDVRDQLDALWKELGPSLQSPEAQAMYERVLGVKAAFAPVADPPTRPIPPQPSPRMPVPERLPEIPVGPEPPNHPRRNDGG